MQFKKIILIIALFFTTLPLPAQSPEEQKFNGYLFTYFEGSGEPLSQEHLRFGISDDGFSWHALNGNKPVVNSDSISQTGGIRDPHILRAESGDCFYLVATDMSAVKNGWKSCNPGIVMMKSDNLVDWQHSFVDVRKTYPEKFGNAQWFWAPQTIYDPEVDRYMVYFTVIFPDSPLLDFYYVYANDNFDAFAGEPQLMFSTTYGAIDSDIILKDSVYHLFFKGNVKNEIGKEIQSGIKQATSKSLRGPWKEHPDFIDAYAESKTPIEGSGVFKLNDTEQYILMYDLFKDMRYEFQRSEDLYHFTDIPESFIKDFNPRHGTVISITTKEMKRLCNKWK